MNEKLSKIKMLAMDIDGTLTDGGLIFYNGLQIKEFNVYDGLGIRVASLNGLNIAWITGNVSDTVEDRAKSLGIKDVYQGIRDKSVVLIDLAVKYCLEPMEIGFVGDDLNDIPAIEKAGCGFAVANAAEEVKNVADIILSRSGGQGAIREALELILKSRNEWDLAVERYINALKNGEIATAISEAVM
jgi:3-deoxy-D-manno-octulosonate 8-phosphate phosphatase (KDO 8-P phosphatase)